MRALSILVAAALAAGGAAGAHAQTIAITE